MTSRKATNKNALFTNIPSQLTVCKAIESSNAVFSWVSPDGDFHPLQIETFQGVGTFASSEHGDPKSKKDLTSSNPYKSDVAYLPADSETLNVAVSLKILSAISSYERCNDAVFHERLESIEKAFFAGVGGTQLAKLYVDNILSGTWLHRNRLALSKDITVACEGLKANNERVDVCVEMEIKNKDNHYEGDDYNAMVEAVRMALAGELSTPLLIDVSMNINVGFGAEVYPSQLWVDADKSVQGKKDAKKHLFVANKETGATGLSAHKVGNGLRAIDCWHGQGPQVIAVSPYGQYRKGGAALRTRALKNDLYTLLSTMMFEVDPTLKLIADAKTPEDIPGDLYYVMASLVRGGVLSFNQKKKGEEGGDE